MTTESPSGLFAANAPYCTRIHWPYEPVRCSIDVSVMIHWIYGPSTFDSLKAPTSFFAEVLVTFFKEMSCSCARPYASYRYTWNPDDPLTLPLIGQDLVLEGSSLKPKDNRLQVYVHVYNCI